MKKGLFIISFFIALSLSGCDDFSNTGQSSNFGTNQGNQAGSQGGFGGSSSNITTVAQAMNLRDDTRVIMQGRITRALGNERYTFTDNTGSMTVEIERRVWGTLSVNENDMVEISGEIDRDRNSVEVDVKSIRRLGTTAGDQGGSQGGFTGPANITTVAQAMNLPDDAPVIMRGRIVNSLGNERYTFTDNTGSITVEIERKVWGTLTVGPNDLVEISGEIDRERNRVEVDVDRIRRL